MATFTVNSPNVTVAFSYTSTIAKVQSAVFGAAESLWNRGLGDHGTPDKPIVFSSLSAQQKLDLVDRYVQETILNLSEENAVKVATDEARITAVSGFKTNNSLG